MCQIQVDIQSKSRPQIPARDNDIDLTESEMACHYSNSREPGDMCHLQYLLKPIWTHDQDQNLPLSYAGGPCQV